MFRALCELALAERLIADPDHEYKPVSWVVHLREDGSLISIQEHRRNLNDGKTDRRGKPKPPRMAGKYECVPLQATRTSGIRPFFLVDKAEYAFGIRGDGKKATTAHCAAFRGLIEACAGATASSEVRAVAAFLQSVERVPPTLPSGAEDGDLYAFKVGNVFVHEVTAVRKWWQTQRDIGRTDGHTGDRCFVTGDAVGRTSASPRLTGCPPVLQDLLGAFDLFPLVKAPGGTPSGVGLSSFNFEATWSFGRRYNDNAPISRAAAESAGTALRRLLAREPRDGYGNRLSRRHIRLSRNAVVVYWSPDGDPDVLDAIAGLTEADSVDAVAEAYQSVWYGRSPRLEHASRFFAMTIVGTQGRAVVQDWFESTVGTTFTAIAAYFADMCLYCWDTKVQRLRLAGPLGLHKIQLALTGDPKKSLELSARTVSDWWRVVLSPRRPLPNALAAMAIQRVRASLQKGDNADQNTVDLCAALLKAWLIRKGDRNVKEYLNRQHPEPSYHCGRMMAVLAEIQGRAQEGRVSATVVRRFFGAVMTSPGLYLGRLQKLAETAHLPHLKGDWPKMLRDEMQSISVQLGDDVPRALRLREQSLFTLGFYQEQAYLNAHPPSRYKYRTDQGEWVQSLGERVVANTLARLGIRYWYEPSVPLPSGSERWPDFMVPHSQDSGRCFIEVLGMMDDAQYRETWQQKQRDYATLGILPASEGGGPGGRLYDIDTTGRRVNGAAVAAKLMEWFAVEEPLPSSEFVELAEDEKGESREQ